MPGRSKKKPGRDNKYSDLDRTPLRQGKLEQAEKSYRIALEMAPAGADTHINLEKILVRQGRNGRKGHGIGARFRAEAAGRRNSRPPPSV